MIWQDIMTMCWPLLKILDHIIEGYGKARIALKKLARNKYLAVVYKEINREDGFIITAYLTSKLKLEKESILWTKK
jgi:hypothetical protein